MPRYTTPLRTPGLRTTPMNVRMNVNERGIVLRAARCAGMAPSAFLRWAVLLVAKRPTHRQLPRWLPENE